MLNVVAIMGRLVADPELKTTPAGVHLCRFRLACDRSRCPPGRAAAGRLFRRGGLAADR